MNEDAIIKRFEDMEGRIKILEEKITSPDYSDINSIDIFEVENEKVILTKYIGEKTVDKTQNIVLLTLLGYKQKKNLIKVPANLLRENVAINEIPLENFGTHVKKLIPQSILRIGKIGSTKTEYRLTMSGEAKARRLLKEVLKNE